LGFVPEKIYRNNGFAEMINNRGYVTKEHKDDCSIIVTQYFGSYAREDKEHEEYQTANQA